MFGRETSDSLKLWNLFENSDPLQHGFSCQCLLILLCKIYWLANAWFRRCDAVWLCGPPNQISRVWACKNYTIKKVMRVIIYIKSFSPIIFRDYMGMQESVGSVGIVWSSFSIGMCLSLFVCSSDSIQLDAGPIDHVLHNGSLLSPADIRRALPEGLFTGVVRPQDPSTETCSVWHVLPVLSVSSRSFDSSADLHQSAHVAQKDQVSIGMRI